MVSYLPPLQFVPIFDSLNYSYQGGSITLQYLIQNYLPLVGGTVTGNLFVNGIFSIQSSSLIVGGVSVTSTGTQLNYVNVTQGIASASSALVLDSSKNITGINILSATTLTGTISTAAQPNITSLGNLSNLTMFGDITMSGHNILSVNGITATTLTGTISTGNQPNITTLGTINITGTTDSTSVSTGCLTLAGGMGIAKSLFVGTGITVPNASGGNLLTLASTATGARTTIYLQTDSQNWEFGARGSTAANPNSMYIYNGGYKLLMNSTGDTSILSTTNSTSYNTGCLVLSGGLGIASNVYCNGTLNLNHNGSNIGFTNGSNSGLIELAASPNILRLVNTYAVNIGAAGVNIGNASARNPVCPLDMGQTASNMIISLYNDTNTYYGLSAANSSLQLSSGGNITMYGGCSNASPINTLIATFSSGGNIIMTAGGFFKGFSSSNLSGQGAKIHLGSSTAQLFGYDYTNSVYLPTAIGNNNIYCGINSFTNMNTSNTTCSFPLAVFGTGTATRLTGTYGWLSGSGTSTSSGFTNRSFSIYSQGGILVDGGEIDSFSSRKLKKNIEELDNEMCMKFIEKIEPISFNYILSNDDKKHNGWIAEEMIKYGFTTLVGFIENDENPELLIEETIIQESGESIIVPANIKLTVSQLDIIPILHKALKISNERIRLASEEAVKAATQAKQNQKKIQELEEWRSTLEPLLVCSTQIDLLNNDLQEQINNIITHLNHEDD